MSFNPPTYTYFDYKNWKGDWELIEGYPFAMAPSPVSKHQLLMSRLVQYFNNGLEKCECESYPELDWIIDEKTVVRPDIAIYCEEIEKYPKTAPKIVVEIVSDSTANKDEEIKFKLYEREKVEYYILVYPDFEKVRIFKLKNSKFDKVYEGDKKFKFDICDIEIDFGKIFKKRG
ncbi:MULTISPECIES: Uma2 family endonuclease [unclassified Lebetimonas]|uniref:Uma2 family endonuclease n=1 Tax=unclassified Lebetimonas TaxID=2648158 RepID=UPI0004662B4D|nr:MULTISPECIES: Uma2 family endonuclease [unclassified Lebetimonas]